MEMLNNPTMIVILQNEHIKSYAVHHKLIQCFMSITSQQNWGVKEQIEEPDWKKNKFNYCIQNFNNQEDISETGIQTDWEES